MRETIDRQGSMPRAKYAAGLPRPVPPSVRFWAKVNPCGPVHPILGTECWLWTPRPNAWGYGRFTIGHGAPAELAHRFAYRERVGPIPEGLELDHLCRVRACVRPEHLEAVPRIVNIRRGVGGEVARARMLAKTACPAGHPYAGDNLRLVAGNRKCRECRNRIARESYHRVRARSRG